jgi:two-component system response regulator HydG
MEQPILVIDDEAPMLELLRVELESRSYRVVTESSPERALDAVDSQDFGVVLTDINMGDFNGVDLCRRIVTKRQDIPVIMMTAFANVESTIACLRAGACDVVTKPFEVDDLDVSIERAFHDRILRGEIARVRENLTDNGHSGDMIGESAAMRRTRATIERVGESDATVLVTGESGTGKELVAAALHARSRRASGPFVAINCAAMPESLLESELFGHVKGAFTDARASRHGLFVQATGGDLFLDEIGEMPLGMQSKLLRALQEKTIRPVGDAEVPFDARIIAATNRDLETEVANKRFREDLYYRINVISIEVPPLRERETDILTLAHTFLKRAQPAGAQRVVGIQAAAAERLLSYHWPGNVRELQNCIERAVALTSFDHVGVDDLPERIARCLPSQLPPKLMAKEPGAFLPVAEIERRYVCQVLEGLGGNKALAARVLGMDRRTLYRKLDQWRDEGPSTGHGLAHGQNGG